MATINYLVIKISNFFVQQKKETQTGLKHLESENEMNFFNYSLKFRASFISNIIFLWKAPHWSSWGWCVVAVGPQRLGWPLVSCRTRKMPLTQTHHEDPPGTHAGFLCSLYLADSHLWKRCLGKID